MNETKALEECMREYISDGGSKEVYDQAAAELKQLQEGLAAKTAEADELNNQLLSAELNWNNEIGKNDDLRTENAELREALEHVRKFIHKTFPATLILERGRKLDGILKEIDAILAKYPPEPK